MQSLGCRAQASSGTYGVEWLVTCAYWFSSSSAVHVFRGSSTRTEGLHQNAPQHQHEPIRCLKRKRARTISTRRAVRSYCCWYIYNAGIGVVCRRLTFARSSSNTSRSSHGSSGVFRLSHSSTNNSNSSDYGIIRVSAYHKQQLTGTAAATATRHNRQQRC